MEYNTYKPVVSLVNGKMIKDLLDLCNDNFTLPWIQQYSGANYECKFCGTKDDSKGGEHHSECPVDRYKDLVEKHNRWIVKK